MITRDRTDRYVLQEYRRLLEELERERDLSFDDDASVPRSVSRTESTICITQTRGGTCEFFQLNTIAEARAFVRGYRALADAIRKD